MYQRAIPLKIVLKNLSRMFWENFVAWGILAVLYTAIVILILQTVLFMNGQPLPWNDFRMLMVIIALGLIPGALMKLPLPALPLSDLSFIKSDIGSGFFSLYCRHHLRRMQTWLILTATFLILFFTLAKWPHQILLWIQIPVSAEIFCLNHWRDFLRGRQAQHGAQDLLQVFTMVAFFEALIILSLLFLFQSLPLSLLLAGLAAVSGAAAVALEGDSGRPVLVNLIAMGSGALWGGLVLWHWAWIIGLCYFVYQLWLRCGQRLHSLERLDHDALIP